MLQYSILSFSKLICLVGWSVKELGYEILLGLSAILALHRQFLFFFQFAVLLRHLNQFQFFYHFFFGLLFKGLLMNLLNSLPFFGFNLFYFGKFRVPHLLSHGHLAEHVQVLAQVVWLEPGSSLRLGLVPLLEHTQISKVVSSVFDAMFLLSFFPRHHLDLQVSFQVISLPHKLFPLFISFIERFLGVSLHNIVPLLIGHTHSLVHSHSSYNFLQIFCFGYWYRWMGLIHWICGDWSLFSWRGWFDLWSHYAGIFFMRQVLTASETVYKLL